jgi:hypothetical protein
LRLSQPITLIKVETFHFRVRILLQTARTRRGKLQILHRLMRRLLQRMRRRTGQIGAERKADVAHQGHGAAKSMRPNRFDDAADTNCSGGVRALYSGRDY